MAGSQFQFPKTILSFSLLTFFYFFRLSSSQYTLPNQFFINCGSDSAVNDTGVTFTGDVNPTTFSLSGSHEHIQYTNPSPNTPPLYQTATIFTGESSYELESPQTAIHMVRLHFYPFPSHRNLSTSSFDVWVSGFSLLSEFSIQNLTTSTSNFPVVKEFLVQIQAGKYRIYFRPAKGSELAFVNAIEAFFTPQIFNSSASDHVTPTGQVDPGYNGLGSHALNPIHRINVGGKSLTPTNDSLRRNWVPDDAYIYFSGTERTSDPFSGRLQYQPGGATQFDAPDLVYNTAKEKTVNPEMVMNDFNITWTFGVRRNALHFVRAHFCDIVNPGLNVDTDFYFYVYRGYRKVISPVSMYPILAAPFYIDFVVDSDDSGNMSISIGSIRGSNATAFLNGLEIMELVNASLIESKPPKGKKATGIIIGCAAGGVVLLLILVLGFIFGFKNRKVTVDDESDWPAVASYGNSSTTLTSQRIVQNTSPLPNLNLGLKIPFEHLQQATNNFDPKLMIGQGGFGKVYKGVLPNGMNVAVKRSEPGHGQGLDEFQTEIIVLSRIRHRHLVALIGYCDDRSEMILVYEFMEKGTLKDHLYTSDGNPDPDRPKLSWNQRLQICIDAAQGLHYLHTGSGGIIHRDVKSTNILLDEHYVAKVADFGISRLGPLDQKDTHVSTHIKGSFGYLDPEYFKCLKLTEKSDVYSFGVVLLEVLCARPALNNALPLSEMNLAEWGNSWIKKGEILKIVDPFLVGSINPKSLSKFGETVEKCLHEYGDERPSMIDVLWDLEYALGLQQTPSVRQPFEDSTMTSSLNLPLPVIDRLPSHSILTDDSQMNIETYDSSVSSFPNASQVFSQLNMGDAR